jgi:ribosome-associated protein
MDDGPEAKPLDDRPAIRLDNVLKLAGIAETGGQAKRMIQAGEVRVNGTVETRRKHMLHEGDEVEVGDESFVVELTSEDDLADDLDEEPGEHRG